MDEVRHQGRDVLKEQVLSDVSTLQPRKKQLQTAVSSPGAPAAGHGDTGAWQELTHLNMLASRQLADPARHRHFSIHIRRQKNMCIDIKNM